MMKRNKHKISSKGSHGYWEVFSRILRILEVIAIIGGVFFASLQLHDIRNNQSAQLMLEFNKELSDPSNSAILTRVENGQPIFIENGGSFSEADVDKYLSVFELLNNTYEAGLINDDMLYNGFAYGIEKTYSDIEIQDYLFKVRKEDPLLFAGYERLAQSLLMTDKSVE